MAEVKELRCVVKGALLSSAYRRFVKPKGNIEVTVVVDTNDTSRPQIVDAYLSRNADLKVSLTPKVRVKLYADVTQQLVIQRLSLGE
jgi:hypothetical protein